jgi:hypothetical protein
MTSLVITPCTAADAPQLSHKYTHTSKNIWYTIHQPLTSFLKELYVDISEIRYIGVIILYTFMTIMTIK